MEELSDLIFLSQESQVVVAVAVEAAEAAEATLVAVMSVTIKKRVVVAAKAMVVVAAALAAAEAAASTAVVAVETLVGVLGKPPTRLVPAPFRLCVNVIPCLVSHQFFGLVPFVVPPTK